MVADAVSGWTARQKHTVAATYCGWTLDTFDYFVLVFVFADVAKQFHVGLAVVAISTTLTLMLRPVGAFLFGRLADRFGRRPVLMINIALYSLFGAATALSWDITSFFVIRGLFGIAMGGIWGVGASLALESIKPASRGFVSGLLQAGYPSGYLLASLAFAFAYPHIGWRGMFVLGAAPALLTILYFYLAVPESPAFQKNRTDVETTLGILRKHWRLTLYAFVLLAAFNFFSHGTQDFYPTFLLKQRGLGHATVGLTAIIYNTGAIIGGLLFGAVSQFWGRRRTIIAMTLLSVPVAFLWTLAPTTATLMAGAFMMQFCVQAAWGVMPAHLNELSPKGARGTFPGTVYQLGNVAASVNLPLQVAITERFGGDFTVALLSVAILSALAIALLTWMGPEARDVDLAT